jgi:hypothetical protein
MAPVTPLTPPLLAYWQRLWFMLFARGERRECVFDKRTPAGSCVALFPRRCALTRQEERRLLLLKLFSGLQGGGMHAGRRDGSSAYAVTVSYLSADPDQDPQPAGTHHAHQRSPSA